jgi:hypothetical protein
MSDFNDKHRQRFRRLLEVAHSTTFDGEREAALGAATRLAEAHGMTLREAAGMAEADEPKPVAHRPPPRKPKPEVWPEAVHTQHMHETLRQRAKAAGPKPKKFDSDSEEIAADKVRFQKAMDDAISRGLDADERRRAARLAAMEVAARRRSSRRWRPRGEFVRVLLRETKMTVNEIAATAGVTVHFVIREKLLLRDAATTAA